MGASVDADAPPGFVGGADDPVASVETAPHRGALPSATTLDKLAYRFIAFGFPIWTFGVICGAIWAQQAWARYWGWDPKETWSFVTWVIFAGYLHARATSGWKGRKAAVIALVGFVGLFVTYYAVNLWIRAALLRHVRRPLRSAGEPMVDSGPAALARARGGPIVRARGKGRACGGRLIPAVAVVATGLLLSACSNGGPQDTWDPAGPVAQQQKDLLVPILWVAAAVFVFVEGGFILISLRFRHRKGRERTPAQTHGNTRLELGWTIAPAVVLAVVMVPTVAMIWELDVRDPEAMQVTVKGYQWWWDSSTPTRT